MNRKLFTYTFLISFVLLLGTGVSVSAERLSKSLGLKVKTIYLDPWFGGREKGLFAQKQYGKDITLKIAQKLQGLLEADGFNVRLSRKDDRFVTLEDRSFQAKRNGSDIYLSIKVERTKQDCIRIFIAIPEHTEYQPSKSENLKAQQAELSKILRSLQADSRHEESLALAGKISKRFKDGQVIDCVKLLRGSDYILTNAEMPAVIVNFGVSSTSDKQPYILDEASLDKIARSLAESVKEYAEDRASQP